VKVGDLVRIKKSAIRHYRTACFNHAAANEIPVLVTHVFQPNEVTVLALYSGEIKFIEIEYLTSLGDQ
jgi:hypothetical protein